MLINPPPKEIKKSISMLSSFQGAILLPIIVVSTDVKNQFLYHK